MPDVTGARLRRNMSNVAHAPAVPVDMRHVPMRCVMPMSRVKPSRASH